MSEKLIKSGFVFAAFMNFGVLIFSKGFTNTAINQADPVVMSNFGLLMIVVWGLAYLAAADLGSNIKWLAGAFAVEKLVYVVAWVKWNLENDLQPVYSADLLAGLFLSIYGINDFLFMVFFAYVFISNHKRQPAY